MITIAQQLRFAQRELAIRKRVYPRWVATRKLTQAQANDQLAGMEAIVATLRKQKYLAEISDEMRGELVAKPVLEPTDNQP